MTDYAKLPKELQDKMLKWEQNKPEFKSARALEDVAAIAQDISGQLEDFIKSGKSNNKELGAVLLDIRTSLSSLNGKEAPETPDFAKPIVESLNALDASIAKAIGKINFKPEFSPNIKVNAPDVVVETPKVDISEIVQVLRKDVPEAFKQAINAIPKYEQKDVDFSPLEENFKEMLEKLQSIDTATRMKPLQGSIKVSNPTDISTLAKETKQDDQITKLTDILTELAQKTEASQNQQVELINAIRLIGIAIANPSYVDKSANQMRSQVTGSLTTVTTVTNLTNLANFGTFPADHLQRMGNMAAWATNVRQIIT